MSINVEYNSKELNKVVITNVFKMLERRNIIDSWSDELDKIDDLNQVIINLENINNNKYSINITNAKLSSIVQGTPLDQYLLSNLNVHKIIIARDVSKKVVKQIVSDYKNAEFFFESEMLEDIPSKVFISEHKILNTEERAELLNKFSTKELSKIFLTDMMSRYYGAKLDDVFKIKRPSFTAGKNIVYKHVVNGSWDILFPS